MEQIQEVHILQWGSDHVLPIRIFISREKMKFRISTNTEDLGLTFRWSRMPTHRPKLALGILASCSVPQTDGLSSGST